MDVGFLEMPPKFVELFHLVLRVLGFALVAGSFLLPLRTYLAFFALVCSSCVFLAPTFLPSAPTLVEFLQLRAAQEAQPLAFGFMVCHFGYGMVLGLSAGSILAATVLFARFLSAWLLSSTNSPRGIERNLEIALLVLGFLAVIPHASLGLELFAESFFQLPLLTAELPLSATAWKTVIGVGQMAFSVSLLFLMPAFLLYLVLAGILGTLERVFPELFSSGIVRALTLPFVLLMLSAGVHRVTLFQSESAVEMLDLGHQRSFLEAKSVGK